MKLDQGNPALLTGYGAYGHNNEPRFHPEFVPLLERNWVIALAHVRYVSTRSDLSKRGGGELGTRWHHAGYQLNKHNSINDFIACTEYIISKGYSKPALLTAYGASAGGLMLGAAINKRPELYKSMVIKVPFVDVTTTMLDSSLPLTVHEYDEWVCTLSLTHC